MSVLLLGIQKLLELIALNELKLYSSKLFQTQQKKNLPDEHLWLFYDQFVRTFNSYLVNVLFSEKLLPGKVVM